MQWRALRRRAREQLERLHQRIPLGKLAGELSPVQQTMVAFARALATDARVLILDEPTASLTDTEITELFAVLRSLRDEGVAILYVSHRLEEVFELCDRLTVMRNGETIITKDVADSNIDEVISNMVGRPGGELYPERTTATDRGRPHGRRASTAGASRTSRSPPTRAKCSASGASPVPAAASCCASCPARRSTRPAPSRSATRRCRTRPVWAGRWMPGSPSFRRSAARRA